jgi:CMP-N,N'-diacetyllegionaminic acid synthase
MRILGIIPARGGSKGVLRKNIKFLGGQPLIKYTIDSALKSKLLSEVIVSTEDPEIAEVSKDAGADIPFLRPKDLAEDNTPTLPVIRHAILHYQEQGQPFDAICILQATSPFRDPGMIDACIEKFISTDADTLISVKKVPDHFNPHWVFEEKEQGLFAISTGDQSIIPRRQQLPDTFYRDGMIYLVKADQIINGETLFGSKVSAYATEGDCINIDTIDDWLQAEAFIKQK